MIFRRSASSSMSIASFTLGRSGYRDCDADMGADDEEEDAIWRFILRARVEVEG